MSRGYKFKSIVDAITDAAPCESAGYACQVHAFKGYIFILHADAECYIDYFDESVYGPDPMAVSPVLIPAAFWLFGSGLIGLVGFARRRQ